MNNLGQATGKEGQNFGKHFAKKRLRQTCWGGGGVDSGGGLGLDVAAEAARRYTITSDSCGVVAGSERSARRGGGGLVVPVIE